MSLLVAILAGQAASSITGTASQTIAGIGHTATGSVAIAALADHPLGSLVQSASGLVGNSASATQLLAALYSQSVGQIAVQGQQAASLVSLIPSATGVVTGSGGVIGSAAQVLEAIRRWQAGAVAASNQGLSASLGHSPRIGSLLVVEAHPPLQLSARPAVLITAGRRAARLGSGTRQTRRIA